MRSLAGRPRSLVRRGGWSVLDQSLSAASNVVLAVVVARSVDPASFGAFSIAMVVFGIAVAGTRSMAGQPLQIRFSSESDEVIRAASARFAGFAVLLGLVAGVGLGCTGMVLSGSSGRALLVLAVVLPALLLQDTCRMAFFTLNQAFKAALLDAVWALVQVAGLVALYLADATSLGMLILVWGAAGTLSAGLGFALLGVRPRVDQGLRWVREQGGLPRYLFAEYLVGLGAFQMGLLLVGILAGASEIGALRAAQVLLGPVLILNTAVMQFAVPEVARRGVLTARQRTRTALGVSSGMGVLTVVYVVAVLMMPQQVGRFLLGDSWLGAEPVLLPLGLSFLGSVLGTGPAALLYGSGRARETLLINLVKAPILLSTLVVSAWQWGAVGAAWAFALTEAVALPMWVLTLRRTQTQTGQAQATGSAAY